MSIREELADELRDAMRAKDARKRDVIRQIETEVAIARSRPGFEGEVDDELYRQVIGTYVKKMEKSRQEYIDIGERGAALAEKLGYEVEYLSRWLPRKLDEEATRALIREAIAELGVEKEEKAAGRVVGHLMKRRGEDLDGGLVNRLAREELASD
jgi:uncharacterized protein YqeY